MNMQKEITRIMLGKSISYLKRKIPKHVFDIRKVKGSVELNHTTHSDGILFCDQDLKSMHDIPAYMPIQLKNGLNTLLSRILWEALEECGEGCTLDDIIIVTSRVDPPKAFWEGEWEAVVCRETSFLLNVNRYKALMRTYYDFVCRWGVVRK